MKEQYGANIKAALTEKQMSVRELAKRTGIPDTTLYSAISRNTALNYENAVAISRELSIPIEKITNHTVRGADDMITFAVKNENLNQELLVEFQAILDSLPTMDNEHVQRLTVYMKNWRKEQ